MLHSRLSLQEILEEMIRLKMHLPLRFAKDILWSSGLDEQARLDSLSSTSVCGVPSSSMFSFSMCCRHRILDGLSKNKMGTGEERLMKEFADELSEDKEPSHS